ncbi:MAG: hypothetical protein AAGA75_27910 [Cyanobacteria bacterium P01_E01_bin.6]
MTKKIGLGKLSDFGQTKPSSPMPAKDKKTSKRIKRSTVKMVPVNIKVTDLQRDWLDRVARQIRSNNESPVKPGERVYPQHLIGVAISLLQSSEVDWSEIQNLDELRDMLNI